MQLIRKVLIVMILAVLLLQHRVYLLVLLAVKMAELRLQRQAEEEYGLCTKMVLGRSV